MLYDLAWHSCLQFKFMGKLLTRGWVEVLVIGDTRCGKTKTAERLLRFYRSGEMGTGENTSLAGLLGGMQQISKSWSIVWGKIPRNDRRLVVIDESSNLPVKVIPEFATARSEGIARITKIQTEQTYARTRIIWVSNPRVDREGRGRNVAGYGYGVLTIPELMGRQADIARLDAATVVANGEVPADVLYRTKPTRDDDGRFSSEAARSLIMWAWSRSPEQIRLIPETQSEIVTASKGLAKKYHDSIPLVKMEELPEKLARLSVALATRLFSHDRDFNVVVYPYHVATVVSFLDRIYSKSSMGYDLYSRKQFESETISNEEEIISKLSEHGTDLIIGLLNYEIIRQSTIEDLTGLDRDSARLLLSILVRRRCLRQEHHWYRKSSPFIELLRKIDNGQIKLEDQGEPEF